jgi:23S rRNA G2445 N2-methylase RlmL
MAADRHTFFVTCAPGVEPVLHAEVRALRLGKVERQVGGVRFEGPLEDAWRANLELATAVRVLLRLARFPAADGDALYAGAVEIPWERYLAPEGTLAVQAQSSASALDHTLFLEQRVKDAIVDRLRARRGTRPSVDRDDPDLAVHVHVFSDRVTLSLDSSGAPLHRRGWRVHQGRAPLAETLAAAVLRHSGWDGNAPLLDPFAGSGTILVEAAWQALGLAPGHRRTFGFERWPGHDARRFAALRAERSRPTRTRRRPVLRGLDLDPERVEEARANCVAAGVGDWVEVAVGDARELELTPGWNAWIVTNAPYGQRVGDEAELVETFRALGARLREHGQGCQLALLAGRGEHVRALALRGLERIALVNGGLECVLAVGTV